MVAHRNSADSKSFPAVKPREGGMSTPSRGERCATGRLAVAVCRSCAFSDVWRWQDIDAMRSRASDGGRICAKCVLGRLVVTRFRHGAFPGARRWQNARAVRPPQHLAVAGLRPDALLARLAVAIFSRGAFPGVLPWQDSAAVRSRASIRGKFCAPCIPKAASDGKIASSRQDSRAMHPKTGWLWQDMRAMHPKSPANRLSGTHRAKILPGRAPFRCTGPSNHARRADLAIVRRMRGKDQAENAYVLSKTEP